MSFRSDSQRRAMFAAMGNNKFSHGPHVVYVQPRVEQPCVQAQVREQIMQPHLVERKASGLEILGQAGEKLAGGVVGTFPGQVGAGEGDGYASTNAISGLYPGDSPKEDLSELLPDMITSMWPDSSEGQVVDDRHYYVDVDGDDEHGRNQFSYAPVYAVGDLSAMGVDAVGSAGATTVAAVPLITTLGIGYLGASMALKGKNKLEAEYRKGKIAAKKDKKKMSMKQYYNM